MILVGRRCSGLDRRLYSPCQVFPPLVARRRRKDLPLSFSGHAWTLWQAVDRRLSPSTPLDFEEAWRQAIVDPLAGPLELTGRLRRVPEDRRLVVLVHGLGGCSESSYLLRFAAFLAAQGVSSLRLNLRGADRSGKDFYHAGLSDDLEQALASPDLRHFDTVYTVGFSLGGHIVLRHATHNRDPRLRAAAAVCSPLDLSVSGADLDRPMHWLYRRYLFSGLLDMYAAMQPAYELAHSLDEVRQVSTLRQWDSMTVVPRFGFASADDYYRRASVGPLLPQLEVPALLLASRWDPMVSARSIDNPYAEAAADQLRVVWSQRGGHVSFPRHLDVGLGPQAGLEAQLWSWLQEPQV